MKILDYHIFKSMLNRYLAKHVGGDHRPAFFDIATTYPELGIVSESYPLIRAEFDRVLAERPQLPSYHDIDTGEATISNTTDKSWSVFMLEILGHRPALNPACCPETYRVLDRVPNLIQAFFSILEPGKSIPPHKGPYLGYLRYHLALHVPSRHPPKLVVNAQDYVWKVGEAVLFDDSWLHSVENHSDEMRAVLIVDVLRPPPLLPSLVNRFITNVIARHTYGRKVARQAEQFATASHELGPRRD